MQIITSTLKVVGVALLAAGLSATGAAAHGHAKKKHHHHHHHHAKANPNLAPGGMVIWKKGKPGKCGAYFYFNKKRKMCHDARWK